MPEAKRKWTDQRIEVVLGKLLRTGVIISAVVVLAGGILYFVQNGGRTAQFHVFQGVPGCTLRNTAIITGLLGGRGECVIMVGLLLLIATPIARVLFSAIAFALEKDRTYVAITLVVLGFLLFSLLYGNLI
jgi:uncharacterized membrane protein